jgi:bleomycin hydrolase
MTKTIIAALMLTVSAGAFATETNESDSTGFTFKDVKVSRTTPVKNQNKSGTCWSFAGASFIEDEILHKGGPEVDLSEMFVVRHCYDDKADKYIRMDGKINFDQGGGLQDILYVWRNYGLVPEEVYAGLNYGEKNHAHYEMAAGLTGYLNGVMKNGNKRLSTAWKKGFDGILDAYLGELPTEFTVNGKKYTPESYAASFGLNPNDYICITSFTHHPFYQEFPLEVADNWTWTPYMNVPMDEMKSIVDNALEQGYTVAWAADVSEGGFQWKKGFAVLPEEINEADLEGTELSRWVTLSAKERESKRYENLSAEKLKEKQVTQESRQAGFDNYETTDDHGMTIVGYATDETGRRYYKVKNSWDTNQIYGGYIYVSEPYFLDKTIGIMVNRTVVPKDIQKKFK